MDRFKKLISRVRNSEHSEQGNTLVVFVMLFPLMFTVFGLAIDISIANYVQKSVSSSINTATQITLSQASNPINSDRPMLSEEEAYDIVKRLYAQNTGRGTGGGLSGTTIPFLLCQTNAEPGGVLTSSASVSSCAWTEVDGGFRFSNQDRQLSIEYSTLETSRTAFLQFLGIGELHYAVTGKANTSFSGSAN